MTAREEVIAVSLRNQPPENKSLVNRPLTNSSTGSVLNTTGQEDLLFELPDWHITGNPEDKQIRRTFQFTNYADALQFTADIGALAEQCGHYPTIITTYQKVTVMWHTTESENLQINDFILAAKTSALICGS